MVVASLRNLASFLVELQLLSSKAARLPAVRSSGKNWLRDEQRWLGAVCMCVCVSVVGRGAGKCPGPQVRPTNLFWELQDCGVFIPRAVKRAPGTAEVHLKLPNILSNSCLIPLHVSSIFFIIIAVTRLSAGREVFTAKSSFCH